MSQTLADHIEALRLSWEAGDLDRLTSHWADDIQFSDYLTCHVNLNKAAATELFRAMIPLTGDVKMTTKSIHGTTKRAFWQAELSFTCMADFPGAPYKKGERAVTIGISILEWDSEGKIVMEADHYNWAKPAA